MIRKVRLSLLFVITFMLGYACHPWPFLDNHVGMFKSQFQQNVIPANLPDIEFSPVEVINVLADYDIKHVTEIPQVGPGGVYWGLTQPWNKKIYLSDETSVADRREVVLHELLHAIYYNHGLFTVGPENEAAIEQMAQKLYHHFYDAAPAFDPSQFTVITAEPQPDATPQEEEPK